MHPDITLIINPSTRHFDYTRPGGRASQRGHDFVRRRLWTRAHGDAIQANVGTPAPGDGTLPATPLHPEGPPPHTTGTTSPGPLPTTPAGVALMVDPKTRQRAMRDKQRKTIKAFMSAFTAAVQRRHLWNVLPWDPASVFVLYNQHAAIYKDLLVYYRRNRLQLTPEGLLPPDMTVVIGTGGGGVQPHNNGGVRGGTSDSQSLHASSSLSSSSAAAAVSIPGGARDGTHAAVAAATAGGGPPGTAPPPPPEAPGVLKGHTLLQDLLCAAIHSRAAYGYVVLLVCVCVRLGVEGGGHGYVMRYAQYKYIAMYT